MIATGGELFGTDRYNSRGKTRDFDKPGLASWPVPCFSATFPSMSQELVAELVAVTARDSIVPDVSPEHVYHPPLPIPSWLTCSVAPGTSGAVFLQKPCSCRRHGTNGRSVLITTYAPQRTPCSSFQGKTSPVGHGQDGKQLLECRSRNKTRPEPHSPMLHRHQHHMNRNGRGSWSSGRCSPLR